MVKIITGKIEIKSKATINYLIKTGNYIFISEGIFKLKVRDDKIISLSIYVKPNMEKSFIVDYSKIATDKEGNIDYKQSQLVPPTIGIQHGFYIWGENISVKPSPQGVFSLDAKACVGLGQNVTVPVEKRKHITPEFLTKFLGCDTETFSKFILQLNDAKQRVISTENSPFCAQTFTICGFGLEKHEMYMKAKKCKLKIAEKTLLKNKMNTAKTKLEENEKSKKQSGIKTHRELAEEYAAEIAQVKDENRLMIG